MARLSSLLWLVVGVILSADMVSNAGMAADNRPVISNIFIDSTPVGAEVHTIGGKMGLTPLTINERDIYPNSYPPDQIDMYGMVVIKKAGCEDYRKRLTLTDISKGLNVQLNCVDKATGAGGSAANAPAATVISSSAKRNAAIDAAPPAEAVSQPPAGTAEGLAERRLRQLKLLHELLADGLITEEEEFDIRSRILDAF